MMVYVIGVLFNAFRMPLTIFAVTPFVSIGITFGPAFGALLTMVPAEQG
jgi:multidrug efflux pump subunit AcrB